MAILAYVGGIRDPSSGYGLEIPNIHATWFIVHPVHDVLIMIIAWRSSYI